MSDDSQYRSLAAYYDLLNDGAEYNNYVSFICDRMSENNIQYGSKILDMACGTGEVSLLMHKNGYNVTALDISPEMLSEASAKVSSKGIDDILFTCQDMRSFSLYTKVDTVICLYDSINYLLSKKELDATFQRVNASMNMDGIFIFDVSTLVRYEEYYGNNNFVLDYPSLFCTWENIYNKTRKICDFFLTLFVLDKESDKPRYIKLEESQRQKYFSEFTLLKSLSNSGFELLNTYTDKQVFDNSVSHENPYRMIFIASKKRELE